MSKLSPSMAVALTALVFSLAGTGLAASHYLITNAKQQISAKARRELRTPERVVIVEARGPTGAAGSEGPQSQKIGPQGFPGERGPQGNPGPVTQGYNGERGYPGCGQAPDATWEVGRFYVQECSDLLGEAHWRRVKDAGKFYVCVKGSSTYGERGAYCQGGESPAEQIAHHPSTSEWRESP